MKQRYRETISYLSNKPYIGNIGSGSVSGYWTIWTAQINGYNQLATQPKPRRINQTMEDLSKFRGTLWIDNPHGFDGDVIPTQIKFCEECEEYQFHFDDTCEVCRQKQEVEEWLSSEERRIR